MSLRRLRHPVVTLALLTVSIAPQMFAQLPTPSQQLASLLGAIGSELRTTTFDQQIGADGALQHLPDVTRSAWVADAALWRTVGERARTIPVDRLMPDELTTLRVLQWEASLQRDRAPHWWVDFSTITPYASPLTFIVTALRARPLAAASDTTQYLQLLRGIAPLMDSVRAGLDQRGARGIRLSRDALPAAIALLRAYECADGANPFAVTTRQLASLDAPTRDAFVASAARVVDSGIVPAVVRLTTYLSGPYTASAPRGVGLAQYPGGTAYYAWLVRWHTTLDVTPDSVHRAGLAEVARIERDMATIRRQLGVSVTMRQFRDSLSKDAQFFARTPEEFGARLTMYARRLAPLLDRQFAMRPRAQGDVQRLPSALEPVMTFGYYQIPTPTDSMGHYYFNGSHLEQRTLLTAAPLIAHELWPGHHFQINLALENTGLPAYRRSRYYTAFGEGWGNYASLVAGELGLYATPMERYGYAAFDMFLACRLVVDTGMNYHGWSRDRAKAYMREHLIESDAQIETESLRYSTDIPAQALAYKMGTREFVALRARAERTMGPRFDVRAFHGVVLSSGGLPMRVLGQVVDEWARVVVQK